MRKFRLDLLNGVAREDLCDGCYSREALEGQSYRTMHNAEFAHLVSRAVSKTLPDGSVPDPKWAFIDFRISNLCNLKCRSCMPEYSSSWAAEFKKAGWPIESSLLNASDQQKIINFYIKNVDSIEKIYFAGGEPLLMKEHYALLDNLAERKKFDVFLSYNTNMSVLKLGSKDVLNYWQRFQKISVAPSIDQMGSKAAYVRKGTTWQRVINNVQIVRREAPHVAIWPTITVSLFNILELTDLLEALMEEGVVPRSEPNNFGFNILRGPSYFNIACLPRELKIQAANKINKYIAVGALGVASEDKFKPVLSELNRDPKPTDFQTFLEVAAKVDRIRGESLFEFYPEFERWSKLVSPSL